MKDELSYLEWMSGSWTCEIWGGTFEEYWAAPRGGAMIGMGRHLVGAETRFIEFMSIEAEPEPAMWILLGHPSKGTKEPHRFRLTTATATEGVFEDPGHDFPSSIRYEKLAPHAMRCRLTGERFGEAELADFNFTRLESSLSAAPEL